MANATTEITSWHCGHPHCAITSVVIRAVTTQDVWAGVDLIHCPGCGMEMSRSVRQTSYERIKTRTRNRAKREAQSG